MTTLNIVAVVILLLGILLVYQCVHGYSRKGLNNPTPLWELGLSEHLGKTVQSGQLGELEETGGQDIMSTIQDAVDKENADRAEKRAANTAKLHRLQDADITGTAGKATAETVEKVEGFLDTTKPLEAAGGTALAKPVGVYLSKLLAMAKVPIKL